MQADLLALFEEDEILELSGCNKNRNRDRDKDRDRDREKDCQNTDMSNLLNAKHLEPTLILDDHIANTLIEEVMEESIQLPQLITNRPILIK